MLWRASATSTMQLATAKSTRHIRNIIHFALEGPLFTADCAVAGPGDVLIGKRPSERLTWSSRPDRVVLAGEACKAVLIPTLGLDELSIIAPSG